MAFFFKKMEKEQVLQERKEAELLVEQGFVFNAGEKEHHIKPVTYGTILHANKYAVDLKLNLLSEDNNSLLRELEANIDPLMKFIAVCVLGNKKDIEDKTEVLAEELKWSLKPKDAMGICLAIIQMYDLTNFISSIRLIGTMTITAPKKSLTTETLIDG